MVDLVRVKRAIEQVETGGGRNNIIRFEKGYAPKGESFTVQGHIIVGTGTAWNSIVAGRWAQWGMASACSYGPAQIMAHTAADLGMLNHPAYLWVDLDLHDKYVLLRLQKGVKAGFTTVEEYADFWNSGSARDDFKPLAYMAQVKAAYDAL